MFRKLRNMFLLLNLLMISAMMIVSFVAIYLITYTNIQANIDEELRRASDIGRRPGEVVDNSTRDLAPPAAPPDAKPPRDDGPIGDRSVTFAVVTDEAGGLKNAYSFFDMDDTFYLDAIRLADVANSESGKLRLDGSLWAFISFHGRSTTRTVFLDITSQQAILTQLIYTFLGVAAVMFVFVYLISRYFADRAIAPIRESFEKQKQFVADASHELRTPIAVINSNVDVLLSDSDRSIDDRTKWLRYIKHESELMTKLTNDLLYLTHMDYTDETIDYAPVDLSSIVENTVLSMEAVFYEADLSIDHAIDPGLSCVGNSERITRVITILLENALKYSSKNGRVDLEAKRRNHTVVLSVKNAGEGIDPEHIDRVFDRFYRADVARMRKSGSYGLGLAIAKTIVEQHRGRIYVKSEAGTSTTFYVELPI